MCAEPTNNEYANVEDATHTGYMQDSTLKRKKVTITESSIGSSVCLASNKTPSIPPSGPCSKIKTLPEEKYDE